MNKFVQLFRKVGGKEILRQYLQAHVLFFAMISTMILGVTRKSLEIVRLAVNNRILCKMRKKYCKFIANYQSAQSTDLIHDHSNKIWVCWLQGLEKAPEIVRFCHESLVNNIRDREIILLTEDNYHSYVEFPQYIQEKIDNGVISRTHMSDLLRLELLNNYGGTWIDATVFCSGKVIPDYMLNSDLFLFQDLKPGLDGHCTCISSWFITSCSNHPIISLTLALLYEYWKYNTKMIDYFLIHDFFQLSIEAYPEEWHKVVPFSNSVPHILLLRLFDMYDEDLWKAVKDMTCFHKLSYKFDKIETEKKETYYDVIINRRAGK